MSYYDFARYKKTKKEKRKYLLVMSAFSIEHDISAELLPLPDRPPPLIRTHKAYCPLCGGTTTSYDPRLRVVPCYFCSVTISQKHIRGFLMTLTLLFYISIRCWNIYIL